jgi:hypothetical protein
LLFAGFLLGLLYDPEIGDNTFLQNVGGLYQAVLCYNPEDHLIVVTSESLKFYTESYQSHFICEIRSFRSD